MFGRHNSAWLPLGLAWIYGERLTGFPEQMGLLGEYYLGGNMREYCA